MSNTFGIKYKEITFEKQHHNITLKKKVIHICTIHICIEVYTYEKPIHCHDFEANCKHESPIQMQSHNK